MKRYSTIGSAIFLTFFGLLTIFMGGAVIFDLFGIRAKEGNYVLFVVWVNWICGFLYLLAAYGFFKHLKWTAKLLFTVFFLLDITFVAFIFHIMNDGVYETQTIYAMSFRTLLTLAFALLAYFTISRKATH